MVCTNLFEHDRERQVCSVKTLGSQTRHSYLPLIDSCPEVAGLIVEHRSKSEIYYVVDVLRAGHEY